MPLPPSDEIAAARALFGPWAPWANLLFLGFVAVATTWLADCAALLLAWRRPVASPEHWTERARRGWPIGVALSLAFVSSLVSCSMLALRIGGDAFFRVPTLGVVVATAGCVAITHFVLTWCVARRARPALRFGTFLKAVLAHLLLFGGPAVVMLAMMVTVHPGPWGETYLPLLLGVAAMAFFVFGGGLWVCRLLGLLVPAPDWVRAACPEDVRAEVLTAATVNAFALPALRSVAITSAMVERLEREEVLLILEHELDHVREPRSVTWRRTLVALPPLVVGCWAPIVAGVGIWGFAALMLLCALLVRGVVRMARRMEGHADDAARGEADEHAQAYARALESVHRANLVPAVLGRGLRTHPDLYDRMLALGVEPEYPRPAPPPKRLLARVVAFFLPVAVFVGVRIVGDRVLTARPVTQSSVRAHLVLRGDSARVLAEYAVLHLHAGNEERALTLVRASTAIDPWWPENAAAHAFVAASIGSMDEARAQLAQAETAMEEWGARPDGIDERLEQVRRLLDG